MRMAIKQNSETS